MENDEKTEQGELSQETTEETVEKTESAEEESEYRGKLNATNRFLEKEGYTFKEGKWVKPASKEVKPTSDTSTSEEPRLSIKDMHALKDVHEDDIDDVIEYANFKKIPISEAKKSGAVQAILANKAETRKTAAATNTGGGKPPIKKLTDDALIGEVEKGNIPEAGSKEAEDYFWAKRGGRRG